MSPELNAALITLRDMNIVQSQLGCTTQLSYLAPFVSHLGLGKALQDYTVEAVELPNYLKPAFAAVPKLPEQQGNQEAHCALARTLANMLGLYDAADRLKPMAPSLYR